jgi:hypothetical protein
VKRRIVERVSRGVYRVLRVITIASDRMKKEES